MAKFSKLHQQAIELKYEGKTHAEISEALDSRLTENTLRQYFSEKGKLYLPYMEYCSQQANIREEEAKKIFKSEVNSAASAIKTVLKNAIKLNDSRLILEASREILDRAGLVVTRKVESTTKRKVGDLTDDELDNELRARGIDPYEGTEEGESETITH